MPQQGHVRPLLLRCLPRGAEEQPQLRLEWSMVSGSNTRSRGLYLTILMFLRNILEVGSLPPGEKEMLCHTQAFTRFFLFHIEHACSMCTKILLARLTRHLKTSAYMYLHK